MAWKSTKSWWKVSSQSISNEGTFSIQMTCTGSCS
jgi:hypothetical protein